MTTREFINLAYNGKTNKRQNSSVFADNGDIYSYGYHYPLLFRIKNKHGETITVRNVRGYSNTTERHILWTRDIEAIDIHTLSGFRLSGGNSDILKELADGQQAYIESVQRQMDAKKRKDTQVYKWLEYDYNRAINNLRALEA